MKVHKEIDVVVVRQNTEGDYLLLEHRPRKNVVEQIRVITRNNSQRAAEYHLLILSYHIRTAFQYAITRRRKKVQCIHKKEFLPLSEQVFIDGFLSVAKRYPEVEHEVVDISQAIYKFFQDPKTLDVVVTNTLDGVMLTTSCLGMLGSPSIAPAVNVHDELLVFEPACKLECHGVNPTAHFLCGGFLLEYIGEHERAKAIRQSLEEVFRDKVFTPDLGGSATLHSFTKAVLTKLSQKFPTGSCPGVVRAKPPSHK